MAALPAVAPIPVISSTQRGAVLRDILQVAEKDYRYTLRSIAAQEIAMQGRLGHKPTGMVVDGRKGKDIEEVTRSIIVWFADRKSLAEAIIEARVALASLGRLVTGRTLGAARYYYSIGKGGALLQGDPRNIAQTVPNPSALNLYVAFPRAHIRKWQWMDRSGARGMRRTRNRLLLRHASARGVKPMQVSASVFERAAKQVQRHYKALDVLDIYISVPNLNLGGKVLVDRIPAIKVRMKVRGRGR